MKHDENINISFYCRFFMLTILNQKRRIRTQTRTKKSSIIQKNNEFVIKKTILMIFSIFFLQHFDDKLFSSFVSQFSFVFQTFFVLQMMTDFKQ